MRENNYETVISLYAFLQKIPEYLPELFGSLRVRNFSDGDFVYRRTTYPMGVRKCPPFLVMGIDEKEPDIWDLPQKPVPYAFNGYELPKFAPEYKAGFGAVELIDGGCCLPPSARMLKVVALAAFLSNEIGLKAISCEYDGDNVLFVDFSDSEIKAKLEAASSLIEQKNFSPDTRQAFEAYLSEEARINAGRIMQKYDFRRIGYSLAKDGSIAAAENPRVADELLKAFDSKAQEMRNRIVRIKERAQSKSASNP